MSPYVREVSISTFYDVLRGAYLLASNDWAGKHAVYYHSRSLVAIGADGGVHDVKVCDRSNGVDHNGEAQDRKRAERD